MTLIQLTISLNDIIYSQIFSKKAKYLLFAKDFAKSEYFAKLKIELTIIIVCRLADN